MSPRRLAKRQREALRGSCAPSRGLPTASHLRKEHLIGRQRIAVGSAADEAKAPGKALDLNDRRCIARRRADPEADSRFSKARAAERILAEGHRLDDEVRRACPRRLWAPARCDRRRGRPLREAARARGGASDGGYRAMQIDLMLPQRRLRTAAARATVATSQPHERGARVGSGTAGSLDHVRRARARAIRASARSAHRCEQSIDWRSSASSARSAASVIAACVPVVAPRSRWHRRADRP
jgi:hypothetical protein